MCSRGSAGGLIASPLLPAALRCVAVRCRQAPVITAVKGVPIRDDDQLAMGALPGCLACSGGDTAEGCIY